jgi:hypothetical protein
VEGGQRSVAVGFHEHPAVRRPCGGEDLVVALQHGRVLVREPPEQSGGSFDVAHDEGDEAGRQGAIALECAATRRAGRTSRCAWARHLRAVEGRVLAEHPLVQVAQLRGGVDAGLVGQRPAGLVEGVQRLDLAPGSVQGEHLQPTQVLPERVLGDELVQLRKKSLLGAGLEVGLDPTLDDGEPRLLQAANLEAQRRRLGEVTVRAAPPERERLAQDRCCLAGPAAQQGLPLAGEALEAHPVHRVRLGS